MKARRGVIECTDEQWVVNITKLLKRILTTLASYRAHEQICDDIRAILFSMEVRVEQIERKWNFNGKAKGIEDEDDG